MLIVRFNECAPDFDSEIGVRIAIQLFKDFFAERTSGYFGGSTAILSDHFTKIAQVSNGVTPKDIVTAAGVLAYKGYFIDQKNAIANLRIKFKNAHYEHVYNALMQNPPETRAGLQDPVRNLRYDVTDIIRQCKEDATVDSRKPQ